MLQRICHLLRFQPPVVDNRGLLWLSGATVPVDDSDGYQTGCLFLHTDGGDDTALYVNEGSVTACDFNPVTVGAAGEMSQIEFNDDLTGPLISIDTTDPTGASYETPFLITGTYSSTCALALQLSITNQRPVSFLFDDGGSVLGSGNYRAVLSRVMLCSTQTGQVAIRAIRGQVKVANGLALNIGASEFNSINGVEGYMELAGATGRTVGANTRVAALHSLTEIRQDITLTAGGKVCGLLVELAQTTAKTVDGIGSAAIAVDRVDSDHADVQAKWTTGIFVTGPAVSCGISVGAYAASQALGSGVVMGTTHTAAVAVFGETAADLTSAYMTRSIRGRHTVNVAGAVNQETYGIQGQLVTKGCTLGHLHAGILGTFEGSTGTVLTNAVSGYTLGHACVIARVGGMANIDATLAPLSGFLAFRQDGALAGGSAHAYSAYSHAGWDAWDVGLYISGGTRGIKIEGTITNDAILIGAADTPLVYPASTTQNTCVSIYADLTDPGTDKFFRGLYVRTRYMPSDTEGGASVYGIRGHVLTVATYDNVGVDENICGVHGYVTGVADALINDNGITVSGVKGELGGSGAGWDVKIACAVEAKVCLTALPSSTLNAYCGVSVYAPTSDATPLDCAMYCWGYIQGGIDLRGAAGDSLDWLFGVPIAAAAVTATGATPIHGTAGVKIAIKVDDTTYYLLASTTPTG